MKRISIMLVTAALFVAVSPIRAEVSGRSGYFRAVIAAEILHGDPDGAQFLKSLGNAPPAVPPALPSAASSIWPLESGKYEALRVRVGAAISRPAHASEDQWRVDRAEADLQLVAYELNQNSRADRNIVRQYLYDAWWALDHHIAVGVIVSPAPARVEPPVAPTVRLDGEPNSIFEGSCATLTWQSTNATNVQIDGVDVTLNGSRQVCPPVSTEYRIMAWGPGGEAQDRARITVTRHMPRAFRIHFDFDEDVIRADAIDTMSKVARILREEPDVAFIVEGHTDWKGANEYNMDLGMRRAEAVRDYFSVNFGIDPQRLQPVSYGEERPLVPNAQSDGSDDPVGRQVNRRAVFVEKKNR